MVKLGDICQKDTSSLAQKDLEGNEGVYPIYGASGFIKYVDFYQQEKPYIAVVKDGAGIGRVMCLPGKSSVIGTMQYIIPSNGVNVNYLAYALEHMNLAKYYTGATIPHIYFKDYCNEILPAHTQEEQQKIAASLGKVSKLIALRKKQLVKLDQLVKARFIELFGDPVSNPHGFPKVPLSELAEIKIGPFGSLLHKEDYIANGHALVNPSHIVAGKISVDDELTVSDEKFSELSAYHLQIGDVVMGRRGEMGRCAVVQTEGLLCGTGSLLIRTKGDVTADYLQKIISANCNSKLQ